MARSKARQRISYVLPLADSTGGHRLGVNGLAVDSANSILYSAGRDGVICAWDLHLDLKQKHIPDFDDKLQQQPATTFRQQVQAHTHWINDIALAQSNQALLSASSDITVKLWRPAATDGMPPQPIGLHTDYVKTLAVPSPTSDWAASGGLDRKICVWDLNGAGQKLCINVGDDEAGGLSNKEKGSVYALAATDSIIASGGPEGTVRVWDARSGERVTKLVGHTDNIRDVLISQDGTTIMTASSDKTVKVWSTGAGRCMYTLTMHDSSVWSLYSNDPDLSVFYSSDRSGMVAKTDTRDVIELDEGVSVSVCQEHEGVHKLVTAGDSIWTATSRPSINRWRDINTEHAQIEVPENYQMQRFALQAGASARGSDAGRKLSNAMSDKTGKRMIPLKHMLRLSNTAYFPTPTIAQEDPPLDPTAERNGSKALELVVQEPVRAQPDYAIQGQNGIIKHIMLNDRKRVLTTDTAGEVVMWDLLKCVPIRSYGKRHLEDVQREVTTTIAVANWCTVDTRIGSVTVVLEDHTCFDAEMYADDLDLDAGVEYREDQRINLGKWVLRYLFSNLISEEIKRDEAYRQDLLANKEQQRLQRANAPTSIELPSNTVNGWHADQTLSSASTLKANGVRRVMTPGAGIGVATPGPVDSPAKVPGINVAHTTEEGSESSAQRSSQQSDRKSDDKHHDYFSTDRTANADSKTPKTPGEGGEEPTSPNPDGNTPSKFGKKFRMGMSFSGMKKIGRTSQPAEKDKPAATEAEKEIESDARSNKTDNSRVVDDNFLGAVQKIRFAYEDTLSQQIANQQAYENGLPVQKPGPIQLTSGIVPSLPAELPVLQPPPNTTILIQEERPEAGGVADLFEGTVRSIGESCDMVEKVAPMWLGEVLLRNQVPFKDMIKVSFILEPYDNLLPAIASDGNNRLNANRMLRAKKILGYVAERVEPQAKKDNADDPNALKPEEYLELYCHEKLVPPSMTLMTIRSLLWRGGGDVILYYKANGRKDISYTTRPTPISNPTPSESGRSDTSGGITAPPSTEPPPSSTAQT